MRPEHNTQFLPHHIKISLGLVGLSPSLSPLSHTLFSHVRPTNSLMSHHTMHFSPCAAFAKRTESKQIVKDRMYLPLVLKQAWIHRKHNAARNAFIMSNRFLSVHNLSMKLELLWILKRLSAGAHECDIQLVFGNIYTVCQCLSCSMSVHCQFLRYIFCWCLHTRYCHFYFVCIDTYIVYIVFFMYFSLVK